MSNPVIPSAPAAAPPPPIGPSFRTFAIVASGLSAQRARMDVIATNVANADTTRTADGGPYRRRIVEMESVAASEFKSALNEARDVSGSEAGDPVKDADVSGAGVRIKAITEDQTPGPRVYEPGHPDADSDGYVTYPNVRVTDELVDLMDARQNYEALTSVFLVQKSIMQRSLDI